LARVLGEGKKDCEWIYRVGANPGKRGSGIMPLLPVLAPGTALGSRPRVALSSAQVRSAYCKARPRGNSRLSHIPAYQNERILLDPRAKTVMCHEGGRAENDCRRMSRAISYSYMTLSISTFEKGALSATGSR
jgi:hypothetical protein